ncbi:HSF-type DNA-binding-domain-containing protein [Syncephalis pseudoplumigaleata]|uniref:HSF-type DNA-binding-domain-containing protein n=1 Tax=Syncephalis pseudoplumigaleata TaxID=1712513 RepID=A0A4P9Z2G9_9FUNG|nr:HSF-type DNA-binding-domain-containing protein [Syncephalis pseudoplumigaleata]|eukprot:RKP26684.1 HSF-type DNA-binding-domain-containing protein [Syncephalis pseudoplumigaleata]
MFVEDLYKCVAIGGSASMKGMPVLTYCVHHDDDGSIIESGLFSSLISWTATGDAIAVWDKQLFTKCVLKQFTSQNHFASFERQLNMYGFKRLSDGRARRKTKRWEPDRFRHDFFQRGRRDLLACIVRRPRTPTRKPSQGKAASSKQSRARGMKAKQQQSPSIGGRAGLFVAYAARALTASDGTAESDALAGLLAGYDARGEAVEHPSQTANSGKDCSIAAKRGIGHDIASPAMLSLSPAAYNPISIPFFLSTLGIDVSSTLCDPWSMLLLQSIVDQLQCAAN